MSHSDSYWQEAYHQLRGAELADAQQQQLISLLKASLFLGRTLIQQPELTELLLDKEALAHQLNQPWQNPLSSVDPADETAVFRQLRRYRNRALTMLLAADIYQLQDIEQSLARVSSLADCLINSAYHWAYQAQQQQNGTPFDDCDLPMPMLILGMGKLGGKELNFSSDIDLIFTYPGHGETRDGRRTLEHQQFFTKVGQKLIAALHQATADGFVYRVDMRLRPFGDSGPLVLSFAALEDYYQEQGRDWERYALLKARVLNPEPQHTAELQKLLKPFIYRRYIDFSAIESLRRMKQLIEQENRRRNRVDNIKLGAGGIREVEFVVQTLQLIRGGRIPQLQQQSLLLALEGLVQHEMLTASQANELKRDYLFLRQVEQALQGIDDKQTQTLPADDNGRLQLLACLNIADWPTLQQQVADAMARVHQQFKLVIDHEDSPEQQELGIGRLLWGSQLPPAELAEQLDWLDTEPAVKLIEDLQAFRQDCQKRSVGPRGHDFLSKLMPILLHLLQTEQADSLVLSRVLGVFRQIMTRTAYLELLFENPAALQQLVLLCTQSGWLAEQLARYPMLLDELIDPEQLYRVADKSDYQDRLRQYLLRVPDDDLELLMETFRQYKQAQQLRIAAADISGALPLMQVSDHLTWLAEVVMEQVVAIAWQQMTARYGLPEGASETDRGFAVIAYGKMGGLELGYGSDLDLVFLHRCDSLASTNGDKAIDSRQFYLKLAQRVLHLATTRTNSGVLYDIDTRLRPSGNSGLLAIHIDTYFQYLRDEAWTWEHQALVRARLIIGAEQMTTRFNRIRADIIELKRDAAQLRLDVVTMRQKLRSHHGSADDDVKHSAGGIVDLEFISQYLVLAHGKAYPALYRFSDNIRILDAAADAGLLAPEQVAELQQAYQLLRGWGHRLTLAPARVPTESRLAAARAAVEQVWQQLFSDSQPG
ncbi:bifunctional [glutamate--ammonia ligase]-adenylyl-L-tyrosine phosphorylase/[glutamate--ammonia-ligase] adenylyltransferase [Arsukibacterium indicum]|uniref:Bifunctional glutamine synthetase adenylyltransferase/adenylyl-removing enzyme n=1 Tax=Arsukibacterium indicum TaxID=2848612 RepID=A0ABS6ML42_9GAMM|nr:bifunctional [glutamate--ammonia ligase]-adenylyl-L-tyrosine phosphorylase/[glutamate--ammonia-ligase] adenylyltransferase [Arsukibacterium indicum]MBV2128972.1 bifunctional [glutamate--ammonia ligase]-adenylyl-L-tyrosine phosphorylase/[glutamate--ammonia-ligase] adenylyltransferase [Arsukibacterium indicum]